MTKDRKNLKPLRGLLLRGLLFMPKATNTPYDATPHWMQGPYDATPHVMQRPNDATPHMMQRRFIASYMGLFTVPNWHVCVVTLQFQETGNVGSPVVLIDVNFHVCTLYSVHTCVISLIYDIYHYVLGGVYTCMQQACRL